MSYFTTGLGLVFCNYVVQLMWLKNIMMSRLGSVGSIYIFVGDLDLAICIHGLNLCKIKMLYLHLVNKNCC